jgi:transketolase
MMVGASLKAAKLLEQSGLSVKVVDVHTIKPLYEGIVLENRFSKLIVTVEEHNIIGGLGSAIAEKAAELVNSPPLLRLGIKDTFCKVGDYDFLLSENRLQPDQIAEDIHRKYKSI